METALRRFAFVSFLVAGFLAAPAALHLDTARADMMSACSSEIAAVCSDVRQGRGRIAACLYANDDKLGGACAAEVKTISESRTFQRYLPTTAGTPAVAQQEAELRSVCTAASDRVCTSVSEGKGRILACVYSRSRSMSKPCSDAARAILN